MKKCSYIPKAFFFKVIIFTRCLKRLRPITRLSRKSLRARKMDNL